MKNSAPQTSAISMVWPKSGCSTSSATTATEQARARSCWPACRAGASISANSQAIRITKAGFRNSDGWMLTPASTIQRRAPFTSAPKTSVAAISARLTMKTTSDSAADLARRQERDRDHHQRSAGSKIQRVPVDEVERVEPDARSRPAGSRRATARCRPASARAMRRQHQPVDRPPPVGETACVRRARSWKVPVRTALTRKSCTVLG